MEIHFHIFLCQYQSFFYWIWLSGSLGIRLMLPSHSAHCIGHVWTLVRPQPLQKMMHWCCLACVQLSLLIFRRSLAERLLLVPLSFPDLVLGCLINVAKVLVSLFISAAKTLIKSPSFSLATILCFSVAVKFIFISVLIDQ